MGNRLLFPCQIYIIAPRAEPIEVRHRPPPPRCEPHPELRIRGEKKGRAKGLSMYL
jgi:hypothetical protein